jgi:divalent metal cation (Fe/Co/Zn/Cd) transporter
MGISIVIDLSRSRALYRVAQKTNSQALEADALHFSTDVWSSSVVIGGLVLVRLADVLAQPWLVKADALAALGVAGIVIHVSLQLGRRTVAALLDAAPAGLKERLIQAALVPGVVGIRQARLRQSGPETFADLTLTVEPGATVERAHAIASAVESAVEQLIPGSDVIVHLEPTDHASDSAVGLARRMAAAQGLPAHGVRLLDIPGNRTLELQLEVPERLSLGEAHLQAVQVESAIRQALPEIARVLTHLEPSGDGRARRSAAPAERERVIQVLEEIAGHSSAPFPFQGVELRRQGDDLELSFDCRLSSDLSIAEAHDLTEQIERQLRAQIPSLTRVVIGLKPHLADGSQHPEGPERARAGRSRRRVRSGGNAG